MLYDRIWDIADGSCGGSSYSEAVRSIAVAVWESVEQLLSHLVEFSLWQVVAVGQDEKRTSWPPRSYVILAGAVWANRSSRCKQPYIFFGSKRIGLGAM